MTDEIRSDLVIEVFRPPFWDQILFELPCILVSPIQTPGGGGGGICEGYSSLCKFHCWKKGVDSVLQEALRLCWMMIKDSRIESRDF